MALSPLCGPGCAASAEVILCSVFRQVEAGGGPGDAVTCHQSEQQMAEDTTMSCAEGDDIGSVVSSLEVLNLTVKTAVSLSTRLLSTCHAVLSKRLF